MTITIEDFVHQNIVVCVSSLIYELTQTKRCPKCNQVHTCIPEEDCYQLWTGSINWEEAQREMLSQSGYILIQALANQESKQDTDKQWGLFDKENNNWVYFPTYDTKQEVIEDYFASELDTFRSEVMEHWVVTPYFGRKLREENETVVEMFNLQIWCRSTTNTAISTDWVIQQIYKELISK